METDQSSDYDLVSEAGCEATAVGVKAEEGSVGSYDADAYAAYMQAAPSAAEDVSQQMVFNYSADSMASPTPPSHPLFPLDSSHPVQLSTPPDSIIEQTHTRNYQACIPCRQRKVKCNLGPVDNPLDPPCYRCRREGKHCYFSAVRRKRKARDSQAGEGMDPNEAEDDYEARNGRRQVGTDSRGRRMWEHPSDPRRRSVTSSSAGDSDQPPLTPGGGIGQPAPLRRPENRSAASDEEDQMLTSATAAILQQKVIYSGHDALQVLAEVAEHDRGPAKRRRTMSLGTGPPPQFLGQGRPSMLDGRSGLTSNHAACIGPPETRFEGMPGLSDALQAWNKLRFVRQGWFTAYEGIAYIDYFYRFMHPLTPITLPDFQLPSTHASLLREEPMLTVTLLMIGSRYMALHGHGATTRSFAIHDKLWSYLQNMINRMNWVQERFPSSPSIPFPNLATLGRAQQVGLRSIGSIESLLLLTEWHPKALHFPARNDNDELMVSDDQANAGAQAGLAGSNAAGPSVSQAQDCNIGSWLEPCWKSDRLCWSLLGNAMTLAYELGILSTGDQQAEGERRRADTIRRLVYIYATQTSGRLSLPSMIPENLWVGKFNQDSITKAVSSMNVKTAIEAADVDPNVPKDIVQTLTLHFWSKLAQMFHHGNKDLFPSREVTTALVTSGRYQTILDNLATMHMEWREHLDHCKLVPSYMRRILIIEYEYMRVYGNCLALQAVVERCAKMGPKTSNNIIHPATLSKCYDGDRKYIKDIVLSSQNLLKCIIDGLLPDDYLKHAPVRTYFRVISVSMILLKTFALGATQDDIAYSLSLLDLAVRALSDCIVDDVHIGSRFAELLSILAHRVRSRMVRVSRGAQSKATTANSSPTPSGDSQTYRGGGVRSSPSKRGRSSSRSISERRGGDPPTPLQQTLESQRQTNQQWAANVHNQQSAMQVPSYQPSPRAMDAFAQYAQQDLYRSVVPSQTWIGGDPLRGISPSFPYNPNDPGTSNIMPPPAPPAHELANHRAQGRKQDQATSPVRNELNSQSQPQEQSSTLTSQLDEPFANLASFPTQETWCALPLDPLFVGEQTSVTHSGFGPNIDGHDMLDVLLQDDVFNEHAGPH